ncbi:NAD-P-binding protein [Lactarius akahatsu]|uniref:NAD-P-binding protein n=1 Tax=Lactarius akahatsu TaxID=416441 RepID=A0AAD4LDC5_9AGAM|nr:NAD-P-binding protein [Lactarius akahatsu]
MVSDTARVWFITGASTGLGLALTRSVLARGDHIIATARSLKSFDELRQDPKFDGTRLRFLTLDVTSPMVEIKQRVDEALAIWGRIDVVVNNAGRITYGLSEELGCALYLTTPIAWEVNIGIRVRSAEGIMNDVNTNFVGPINVTNAVLPSMRARRDGTIVFIGSRSTYRTQIAGIVSYSASKAALHSYAETLSKELEHFNIRVTIAVPGSFATKFNAPIRSGTPLAGYEALRDHLDKFVQNYAKIPMGDPDLGMSALVDVVRGEGRAANHGPPPLWLFLGEDSMRDVRLRTQVLQSTLEEWKEVGSNLGLPQEQTPA